MKTLEDLKLELSYSQDASLLQIMQFQYLHFLGLHFADVLQHG